MHRRSFLRNTTLAFAALPFSHNLKGGKGPVVGHNNKKYRLDKDWSRADAARFPVNDCHEMVQDRKGRILLLTNDTSNNVLVYDTRGRIKESWGTEYPGAHGLTLFDEGGKDVLYICDNNRHQVIKTDTSGKVLRVLDYPKASGLYKKADEYIPTETAIAPNGELYVADGYGKDYIHRYDADGRYLGYFGGRGATDGHLLNAHGICVDLREKELTLVVTSRQQHAFKRYKLDGTYINTVHLPGAWVCRPVISGSHLFAAVLQSDRAQGKQSGFLTILDKDWKVVSNPGGNSPQYQNGSLNELKQEQPFFSYPHDVCVDRDENLYVAQWNSGKVYPYKLQPVG